MLTSTLGNESMRSSSAAVKAMDKPLPAGLMDILHNL
jgi:hypothetical protein